MAEQTAGNEAIRAISSRVIESGSLAEGRDAGLIGYAILQPIDAR
jgi:hypothetical protein